MNGTVKGGGGPQEHLPRGVGEGEVWLGGLLQVVVGVVGVVVVSL